MDIKLPLRREIVQSGWLTNDFGVSIVVYVDVVNNIVNYYVATSQEFFEKGMRAFRLVYSKVAESLADVTPVVVAENQRFVVLDELNYVEAVLANADGEVVS